MPLAGFVSSCSSISLMWYSKIMCYLVLLVPDSLAAMQQNNAAALFQRYPKDVRKRGTQ